MFLLGVYLYTCVSNSHNMFIYPLTFISKLYGIVRVGIASIRTIVAFIRAIVTLKRSTNESMFKIAKELLIFELRGWVTKTFSTGLMIRYRDASHTDLIYHDGSYVYTIRFPKQRGPKPFVKVIDENGNDVTDVINKFLGPHNNFHGIPTTPKMLGFSRLSFNFQSDLPDGEEFPLRGRDLDSAADQEDPLLSGRIFNQVDVITF